MVLMRILIDTNIFISREDHRVISEDLQDLLRVLNESPANMFVHPLSHEEIERNGNQIRKEISKSKIMAYPVLESPPKPPEEFIEKVGPPEDQNDKVDDHILYSLCKDAVDFLITEDTGIHEKANKVDVSHRVFDISEAKEYFIKKFKSEEATPPPILKEVPMHNIDIDDPIFDGLKQDYLDFEYWWERKSKDGRKAFVYYKNKDELGAILIYNIEDEPKGDWTPSFPKKERLKICTMVATETGYKIGELFIKLSIEKAVLNDIDEIFLTHYVKENDHLVSLIKEFGFSKVATKEDDEAVFMKSLICEEPCDLGPLQISKEYYPSYYDAEDVNKYLIPIKPKFFRKLFPDYSSEKQTSLEEFEKLIPEGNTVKKAYLSHSAIKKINPGDIILFYRSKEKNSNVSNGLTTLGVVEKAISGLSEKEEIMKEIGKRSVYSNEQIEEIADKKTLVILFKQHFHLPLLPLDTLKEIGLYSPQSISEIPHEKYLEIKERGGIDECFTVN